MEEKENKDENEKTFENILTQFIEKIDKISIKNALKESLIINRITSDTIFLITISKVAQLLFSNNENMRYIESKFSEVMEKQMIINVTFENKEQYFERKLENK